MNYNTLKTTFQKELLFFIILNMKTGKITKQYAKRVAKIVLPVFKNETVDEFLIDIEKLCKYSPEISEAFIKSLKEYEKQTLGERLMRVRAHLVTNNNVTIGGEY